MPPLAADPRAISRRTFLRHAGVAAGVGVVAPFAFVRSAGAVPADLDSFIRGKVRDMYVRGASFAVVKDDDVVWSSGYGWADFEQSIHADADTVWMLASVSKTVVCAGVMRLVEDGQLDLDADVNTYLPFQVHIPAAPNKKITMRELLTHTSAIRDRYLWGTPLSNPPIYYFQGDSPISLHDFEQSYLEIGGSEYREGGNFYDRAPGTGYSYCNIAVALAGLVAESISGVDFNLWCQQQILGPLGMTDSGFRLADISTPNLAMPYRYKKATGIYTPYGQFGYPDYPDGALRTSANHLARWLGAFANYGKFQGVRVLEKDTVTEIRRNQTPGITYWHQGLIWYESSAPGYPRMGHTGGDYGVSTRMFFRPDTRVGVVSLTNVYLGGQRWTSFRDVEQRLFDIFS